MNTDKRLRTDFLLNILKREYLSLNYLYLSDIETVLSNIQSVLIITPHPDDEIIGCGGCIQFLKNKNCKITVLFCTQESHRSISPAKYNDTLPRQKEAIFVANELGYNTLFLNAAECLLQDKEEYENLKAKMAACLKDTIFDTVFLPYYNDLHPDHRCCFNSVAELLLSQKINISSPYIYVYEVWKPVKNANRKLLLSTSMYDNKIKAMKCYRTQLQTVDYVRLIEEINKMKGETAEFFEEIELSKLSNYVSF
jgi:LmbE family N-acetylglucosaminyl deacetylase